MFDNEWNLGCKSGIRGISVMIKALTIIEIIPSRQGKIRSRWSLLRIVVIAIDGGVRNREMVLSRTRWSS